MIRNALIIAGASFVLMLGCIAGVAALAGPVILREGWTIPFSEDISIRHTRDEASEVRLEPQTSRRLAWTSETLITDLPVDVAYVPGPAGQVEITGPKAYIDRVRIKDGRLTLADADRNNEGLRGANLTIDRYGLRIQSNARRIKIVVTAPYVTHFQVNGSGDLDIENYDQTKLDLAINGSGDVKATGKTLNLALATAGSGEAELEDLAVKNADVAISGSGSANLTATDVVRIALSGSGDVALLAQPASLTATTSGSGVVRHDY